MYIHIVFVFLLFFSAVFLAIIQWYLLVSALISSVKCNFMCNLPKKHNFIANCALHIHTCVTNTQTVRTERHKTTQIDCVSRGWHWNSRVFYILFAGLLCLAWRKSFPLESFDFTLPHATADPSVTFMQLCNGVWTFVRLCVCLACLLLAFLMALLFLLLLHMSSEVMFGVILCMGDEVIYDIIFWFLRWNVLTVQGGFLYSKWLHWQ